MSEPIHGAGDHVEARFTSIESAELRGDSSAHGGMVVAHELEANVTDFAVLSSRRVNISLPDGGLKLTIPHEQFGATVDHKE